MAIRGMFKEAAGEKRGLEERDRAGKPQPRNYKYDLERFFFFFFSLGVDDGRSLLWRDVAE